MGGGSLHRRVRLCEGVFEGQRNQEQRPKKGESLVTALGNVLSQLVGNTLRDTLGLPRIATADRTVTGSGVALALIDSGITPSDDFAGRISAFYDFTRGGISTAPFDDYGHGTHVAGLIGSSGRLSNFEFQGVAPDVRFVGLKVLDKNGRGKTSDVIKAIEFVTATRTRLNVQIVNLSLGHPIFASGEDDPLVQAVEKASRAPGLIVVVAAGNYGEQQTTGDAGYTGINSPGNAPSAITVGAVDHQRHVKARRRHGCAVQLARTDLVRRASRSRTSSRRGMTGVGCERDVVSLQAAAGQSRSFEERTCRS